MQEHSLFSYNLIQQTIDVFKEEDGILISEAEAVEILHSFAGLYLAFTKQVEAPAAIAAEPDLINPHYC